MSFREIPLMKLNEGTVLFHPYISKNSFKNVKKVLSGRWIGQGPLVDKFELKFKSMFAKKKTLLSYWLRYRRASFVLYIIGFKKR